MKKIFLLVSVSVMSFSNYCFAQNYFSLLTNGNSKTWQLTDMYINTERFIENESTCIYQITLTFTVDGTYTKTTPCSTAITKGEKGAFSIVSDSLIINNFAFKIVNLTTSSGLDLTYKTIVTGPKQAVDVPVKQHFEAIQP